MSPERFEQERAELLELLRTEGILHASPSQPVRYADGSPAAWMLDSLLVTLTPHGARLAGRCLAHLLSRFEGRQLATYGVIGIPLLQACILQSDGRYRGLVIRKERKGRGSAKLVEGPIDPDEPVILVDDSIVSGRSMLDGIARLEEAGLRVEGAVCLVRFGWAGGVALLQQRGYHVETLYDIYEDFTERMDGEPKLVRNPSKVFPEIRWSARHAPEGLHPARLAREVMGHWLRSGELLLPPGRLDRDDAAPGGAWVSVRPKQDIYARHARGGFWHFPDEPRPDSVATDVTLASLQTARMLPAGDEGLRRLDESAVAVTFFSALEECGVGQLDNERYGIVVCSRERPGRMGGALPRMPGIAGAWQQLQHARMRNAGLLPHEPYRIFRHEVLKVVEPGAEWPDAGAPAGPEAAWSVQQERGGPVAERVRDLALACLGGTPEQTGPLPDGLLPLDRLDALFVSVYLDGRLRGCQGSAVQRLDEDLRRLVQAALADERFGGTEEPGLVAATVSLLHDALVLGEAPPDEIPRYVRHARQALRVGQGQRSGMLLPFVAVHHSLDPRAFALEVIDKAGITRPPYLWQTFDCATWLADGQGPACLLDAPPREAERPLLRPLAEYLVRQQRADGTFYRSYEPFLDVLFDGPPNLAWLAYGTWTLLRAHGILGEKPLLEAARKALACQQARLVQDGHGRWWLAAGAEPSSIAEVAFLLLALGELSDPDTALARSLAASLWSRIDRHGRIATHAEEELDADAYQDYFPGQALLALARSCERGFCAVDRDQLDKAFRLYRHRFRHRRDWGQVAWQAQAFAAWWRLTREPEHASFVFEIADWALGSQQETSGGFLTEQQPDPPGFTTGLYLEGIGAALQVAVDRGDEARQRRYREAGDRGLRFLGRLVIQDRDRALLPNFGWAAGGVRQSPSCATVRIDYVQHALAATIAFLP
jgi:orotate phosphoribosyltransferase